MKSTSISVKASVFARLEKEAERRNVAVSSLVEQAIAGVLGTQPKPRPFRRRRTRKVGT